MMYMPVNCHGKLKFSPGKLTGKNVNHVVGTLIIPVRVGIGLDMCDM